MESSGYLHICVFGRSFIKKKDLPGLRLPSLLKDWIQPWHLGLNHNGTEARSISLIISLVNPTEHCFQSGHETHRKYPNL